MLTLKFYHLQSCARNLAALKSPYNEAKTQRFGCNFDNFNRSWNTLYTPRAERAAASASTKGKHKKKNQWSCLLTELGRAARENTWLSVRTHSPSSAARSVRPDLEPNIFSAFALVFDCWKIKAAPNSPWFCIILLQRHARYCELQQNNV